MIPFSALIGWVHMHLHLGGVKGENGIKVQVVFFPCLPLILPQIVATASLLPVLIVAQFNSFSVLSLSLGHAEKGKTLTIPTGTLQSLAYSISC